jgi:hypothetical protein
MNREEIKEIMPLIQAFAEGKKIGAICYMTIK